MSHEMVITDNDKYSVMLLNTFMVFTEGDELYEDMLAGIRNAQVAIAMESYIFEPDEIGLLFIEALIERASAGVSVKLHLDAFGSALLSDSPERARMQSAGIALKWFNPWRWLKPFRFNRRNHRKLLVVDDHTAWLGGFNIHRENSLRVYGKDRWLDVQVRIEGPLAKQAVVYFNQLWHARSDWSPRVVPSEDSILVSNHNQLQRHQLRRMLALQFHKAKKQIWLCTPYFMPDHFLQEQMVKAARRGIDVRLLLPYETDRPITQWVARATYTSLIACGVRIYEYEPRFIHAKMMIIDSDWCTVGSANLDYRSFFVNYEINLVSSRPYLVEQLQQIYSNDLAQSRKINAQKWAQRGWQQRLYQMIGAVLRRIL